jgi:hypothetical protein
VPECCELFSLIDTKGALVPDTVQPTRLRASDRIMFAAGLGQPGEMLAGPARHQPRAAVGPSPDSVLLPREAVA